MELGCAMAPSLSTPDHIRIAEELGYVSAWCFYSPAIYADPWMTLARSAERTSSVGLGVSVMVPRLRHVADVATSTATLHQLAPGRVTVVVGSGFSSVALLGGKSVAWATIETYVRQLRSLLAGRPAEIDGVSMSLLHAPASGISLPIQVPIWVAAHGPKALGVASRAADGIITNPSHGEEKVGFQGKVCVNYYGTVLDDGEDYGSPAVLERVGPAAALALHMGPYGPVAGTPEERAFTAEIEKFPLAQRPVETHRGHMIAMSDLDRRYVTGDIVRDGTLSGSVDRIRAQLDRMRESGVSRFCYTPVGPDIPRELEAFAKAFQS